MATGSETYGPSLRDVGSDLFTFVGLVMGGLYAGYLAWRKSKEAKKFMVALLNEFSSTVLPLPDDESQLEIILSNPKKFKSWFELIAENIYDYTNKINQSTSQLIDSYQNTNQNTNLFSLLEDHSDFLDSLLKTVIEIENTYNTLLITRNIGITKRVINTVNTNIKQLYNLLNFIATNNNVNTNIIISNINNNIKDAQKFIGEIKQAHQNVKQDLDAKFDQWIQLIEKRGERLLSRLFSNYEKYEQILRYFIDICKIYSEQITSQFETVNINLVSSAIIVMRFSIALISANTQNTQQNAQQNTQGTNNVDNTDNTNSTNNTNDGE